MSFNSVLESGIEVTYAVKATAVITLGVYDGPMTAEAWREQLVSNPDAFSFEWTILEVTDDGQLVAGAG